MHASDSATARTAFTVAQTSFGTLDVLRATHLRQRFAPHMHDYWAIGIIEAGCNRLRYRGREYVAGAGALVVIPPGEMHTGEPMTADGWSYRMMYPSIALVHACLDTTRDLPSLGLFPRPVLEDSSFVARFRAHHQRIFGDAAILGHDESVAMLLHDLFARHALRHGVTPRHRGRSAAVRVAREYIESHATPDVIRLSTLVELTGVNQFQLIRLFNRELGMSPYAYVKQLRVRRAQSLLQSGQPVAQVAYAVGFSDQSHMTRMFKCVLGMTPGAYARAVARA